MQKNLKYLLLVIGGIGSCLFSQAQSTEEGPAKSNSIGLGMILLTILVIFLIVLVLYLVYRNKVKKAVPIISEIKEKDKEVADEVNAALSMTLYLYQNEVHDMENTILTMQKVSRTYSPWSSKIYMLRKLPR